MPGPDLFSQPFGIQYRDVPIQAARLTPAQALMFAKEKPAEELYDVVADPWETRNLADDPIHQAELARLREVLDRWIAETDPVLSPPQ